MRIEIDLEVDFAEEDYEEIGEFEVDGRDTGVRIGIICLDESMEQFQPFYEVDGERHAALNIMSSSEARVYAFQRGIQHLIDRGWFGEMPK